MELSAAAKFACELDLQVDQLLREFDNVLAFSILVVEDKHIGVLEYNPDVGGERTYPGVVLVEAIQIVTIVAEGLLSQSFGWEIQYLVVKEVDPA